MHLESNVLLKGFFIFIFITQSENTVNNHFKKHLDFMNKMLYKIRQVTTTPSVKTSRKYIGIKLKSAAEVHEKNTYFAKYKHYNLNVQMQTDKVQ